MRYRWFAFLILLTAFVLLPVAAFGQGGVTFAPTEVTIDFPNSITFDSSATSSGPEIVRAQFIYYLDRYGASDSTTRETLDIQPGQQVDLHYEWDTRDLTVTPWTPIVYRWRVIDADGNSYESEPQKVFYKDTRFNWQERSGNDIIVLWHDKPAVFGEEVLDIAEKAIEREKKLFGTELAIPIRIIVYNNSQEFNDWHSVGLDWVGGEAFPDYGITTQIVTSKLPDSYWLNAVIPHELSHLYLYQAAYNPTAPIPVWLNEGIAQYNEFSKDNTAYLVEQAARDGRLIPLTSLAAGFGQHDEPRIRLSYAEGLSAVQYLVDTYGEAGLARLLAAYKQGLSTDDAFQEALGVSMGQFQQDWAESVGAPAGSMVTPTPWPMPTFPPTPTPMRLGGAGKTPAPQAETKPTAAPTATSTPETIVQASPTPAATDTPGPQPTAAPPAENSGGGSPFCSGLFILVPLPLAALFIKRKHDKG